MTKRIHASLADYVTMALSPVLIMGMVVSLCFFLVEIIYGGQRFESRLQWTLFWFSVGIVLIARISMHPAAGERAGLYGLGLGLAVWFAMSRFFSFELALGPSTPAFLRGFDWLINGMLIAVLWWSAHRLTWDCTFIDDNIDASGKGLLEAAGLDETAPEEPAEDETPPEEEKRAHRAGLAGWWDRYRAFRARQKKKPHTPGLWVVYYSLAALPLFGLGQAMIPPQQQERRRYAFWLLSLYVACGLGLLLTTAFLGLRRYLRQRKLEMPVAMTSVWLALGGGLIAVIMVLSFLLPRPEPEYSLLPQRDKGKIDRDASKYAVLRDDAGKGEGRSSNTQTKSDPKAQQTGNTKSDKSGSGQGQGKQSGNQSGKNSSQQGNSSSNQQNQGKQQTGKQGDQRNDSQQGDQRGKQANDSQQANNNQANRNQGQQKTQKGTQGQRPNEEQKQKDEQQRGSSPQQDEEKAESSDGGGEQKSSPQEPGNNPLSNLLDKFGFLGTILKWVVFALLVLVVLFFVFRSGLKWLANFTDWARRLLEAFQNWWASLFGGSRTETEDEESPEEAFRSQGWRPRPFALFPNPFMDGTVDRMSPDQVARYSFEALQAWAHDRDLGRRPEETPMEFAERIGTEVPALEEDVRRLVGLYARVAYARNRLTRAAIDPLKELWTRLDRTATR